MGKVADLKWTIKKAISKFGLSYGVGYDGLPDNDNAALAKTIDYYKNVLETKTPNYNAKPLTTNAGAAISTYRRLEPMKKNLTLDEKYALAINNAKIVARTCPCNTNTWPCKGQVVCSCVSVCGCNAVGTGHCGWHTSDRCGCNSQTWSCSGNAGCPGNSCSCDCNGNSAATI